MVGCGWLWWSELVVIIDPRVVVCLYRCITTTIASLTEDTHMDVDCLSKKVLR